MLRPVVDDVAALKEGREVGGGVVGGDVIAMGNVWLWSQTSDLTRTMRVGRL